MASDLKKFVNARFIRTVDLGLLTRVFERHGLALTDISSATLFGDPDSTRLHTDLLAFLARSDEVCPDALVSDLHRIAELGTAEGLEILLQEAGRSQVRVVTCSGAEERDEDPKHVALRMFLDHPDVFNAASDMATYRSRTSLSEFVGEEEGVEAVVDETSMPAFEQAAGALFAADLRGNYCRVGTYEDGDEVVLIVTYGAYYSTHPVLTKDHREEIPSFRMLEQAVLAYDASRGLLKVGGVSQSRRVDMADLFATHFLKKPEFFAAEDAQNLYTLESIERAGFDFVFEHRYDPTIARVRITEIGVDAVQVDPSTGKQKVAYSLILRDKADRSLARLGPHLLGERLGLMWKISHIGIKVHFRTEGARDRVVPVKIKPPRAAIFKRQAYEARIMTLLRKNGLLHDRNAASASVAAE